MSSKTIPVLSVACISALVLYLALLATTVFFAAWQTELAASLRASETAAGSLETEYYAALDKLSAADASAAGLVKPVAVNYVALGGTPALTRAGR